jgi:hypothetical protein
MQHLLIHEWPSKMQRCKTQVQKSVLVVCYTRKSLCNLPSQLTRQNQWSNFSYSRGENTLLTDLKLANSLWESPVGRVCRRTMASKESPGEFSSKGMEAGCATSTQDADGLAAGPTHAQRKSVRTSSAGNVRHIRLRPNDGEALEVAVVTAKTMRTVCDALDGKFCSRALPLFLLDTMPGA